MSDHKRQRGDSGSAVSTNGCMNPFPCVRLRGLPYGARKDEIAEFLNICPIDIVILERNGRPSGQALALCSSPEEMDHAISKDKQHLGARYIEVFQAMKSEYHMGIADQERSQGGGRHGGRDDFRGGGGDFRGGGGDFRGGGGGGDFRGGGGGGGDFRGGGSRHADQNDGYRSERRGGAFRGSSHPVPNPRGVEAVVRLRGLPFEANPVEVTAWIAEHNLRLSRPVSADDVVVATKDGQSIGIAFVEFKYHDDSERVLDLNRKYFGQRYVEVDMSSLEEQVRYTGVDV